VALDHSAAMTSFLPGTIGEVVAGEEGVRGCLPMATQRSAATAPGPVINAATGESYCLDDRRLLGGTTLVVSRSHAVEPWIHGCGCLSYHYERNLLEWAA
jgi:hypothetical protein